MELADGAPGLRGRVRSVSDRLWRANPAFRRLTVARVVSVGGDSLSLVALMLHVAATC